MSDALADLAAGAARCVGPRVGDEMALPGGSVHHVFNHGISIRWADYGFAGHERCSGGLGCSGCAGSDEMALSRVVLCIRFWTMEFL